MDFNLAALKLLCAQLKHARQTPSQKAFTLGGILFQRAWIQVSIALCVRAFLFYFTYFLVQFHLHLQINPKLAGFQGVIVSVPSATDDGESGRFLLDDGTGVIELLLSRDFRGRNWDSGPPICFLQFFFALILLYNSKFACFIARLARDVRNGGWRV